MIFLDFLKVKMYENMLQNVPICTIKHFFREACPRTPLAKAWLRHASQAPPLNNSCPPLGKSSIRP